MDGMGEKTPFRRQCASRFLRCSFNFMSLRPVTVRVCGEMRFPRIGRVKITFPSYSSPIFQPTKVRRTAALPIQSGSFQTIIFCLLGKNHFFIDFHVRTNFHVITICPLAIGTCVHLTIVLEKRLIVKVTRLSLSLRDDSNCGTLSIWIVIRSIFSVITYFSFFWFIWLTIDFLSEMF